MTADELASVTLEHLRHTRISEMSELRFKQTGSYLRRESARTWNRCQDLQDKAGETPTPEQRQELEQAALEWLRASAKAGRAMTTGEEP